MSGEISAYSLTGVIGLRDIKTNVRLPISKIQTHVGIGIVMFFPRKQLGRFLIGENRIKEPKKKKKKKNSGRDDSE